jgi:membrane-associated phospholipid phosphatase
MTCCLFDVPLSLWFHQHPNPVATQFLLFVTHWHSTVGILSMAAVLGLWLWRRKLTAWLLLLVLTVPGGMLLNVGVKHLVRRSRPQFDHSLVSLTSYSFPSGHTAGATVFYGFVALLLLAHAGDRRWRLAIVPAVALMVLLVGLSRIYLGAHYATDVLGAMVEGGLWLALCLAGMRRLGRRGRLEQP